MKIIKAVERLHLPWLMSRSARSLYSAAVSARYLSQPACLAWMLGSPPVAARM
ncbi:MAG: hypothetical protein LBI99_04870 [Propionibacteriaceae bacterium]|jgi:hypothetical protein|nr:hypothetical protein [Propionibacteriaceae bacterium]